MGLSRYADAMAPGPFLGFRDGDANSLPFRPYLPRAERWRSLSPSRALDREDASSKRDGDRGSKALALSLRGGVNEIWAGILGRVEGKECLLQAFQSHRLLSFPS